MNKKTPHSFSCLIGEHAELERLFDSHQRALLEGNVGTALAVVKAFGDELYEHIEYEEKTLLPVFAEEGGERKAPRWRSFCPSIANCASRPTS